MSTSKRVNTLRAAVNDNPGSPSSLKKRFDRVSQNDQFEVNPESGMSSAEKGAAYKEWGRQLADKSAVKAQNDAKKGGTRRKRNSKKRKTLRKRKSKRKSIRKRG